MPHACAAHASRSSQRSALPLWDRSTVPQRFPAVPLGRAWSSSFCSWSYCSASRCSALTAAPACIQTCAAGRGGSAPRLRSALGALRRTYASAAKRCAHSRRRVVRMAANSTRCQTVAQCRTLRAGQLAARTEVRGSCILSRRVWCAALRHGWICKSYSHAPLPLDSSSCRPCVSALAPHRRLPQCCNELDVL